MRFEVTGAHRTFFEQNGYIEFEALFSEIEAAQLATQAVAKHISKPLANCSAEELFMAGHDLWRKSRPLCKMIFSRPLAEIAAQLFNKKAVLIAFDQLLQTEQIIGFSKQGSSSLNDISSIRPLAGAALLHLAGDSFSSPFIPSSKESVLFFSPNLVIPWENFFQIPHQSFLLIAYATPESLYVQEKRDLHPQALKKLGYAYGDRLQTMHHPVLYRKE